MRTKRPLGELMGLQEDMQRLLGMAMELDPAAPVQRGGWIPALDIFETEEAIKIVVDLPGVNSDDIDITVEEGVLTIRGERRVDYGAEDASFQRIERPFGQFQRTMSLPTQVETDSISANLVDGVLEVTAPRAAAARARKIAVGTGKRPRSGSSSPEAGESGNEAD